MENQTEKLICGLCQGEAALWGEKNNYRLYTCSLCKLIFVHPTPDSSTIYNEMYFSGGEDGFGYVDYDADKEAMRPVFERYLDMCAAYGKSGGTLLDVGAATGFFLNIASKRGFKVFGVEMSEFAAGIGRKAGLDVRQGSLREVKFPAEFFDIVTMFDVLEHMADPFAELQEVGRILKPGGLLVVNTPNGESFVGKVLKTKWYFIIPPEHLYYFSAKNLKKYLEKIGFEVVYSGTIGKSFSLSYMFNILYNWQKVSLWKKLTDFFSHGSRKSWAVPINLHDNFFLIARKK